MVAPIPDSPAEYLTDPPPVDPDEEIERLIGRHMAEAFLTEIETGYLRAAILDPPVDAEIIGEDGDPEDTGPERWKITNDGQADWAMARLAAARADMTRLAEQRDEHIARANQWFQRVTREAVRDAAFFGPHLEDYAIRRRAETSDKVKTVDLPSGRISTTRAKGPAPEIANPGAVLEWARTGAPDLIKSTEKVLISDLAPRVAVRPVEVDTDDGETITVDAVVPVYSGFETDEVTYGPPIPGMRIRYPTTTATPKPYEPITTT